MFKLIISKLFGGKIYFKNNIQSKKTNRVTGTGIIDKGKDAKKRICCYFWVGEIRQSFLFNT